VAFVDPGALRRDELLAARVTEIGLGTAKVAPVGRLLHALPFNVDELALDAQQTLYDPL
jgi:hypothetical protein